MSIIPLLPGAAFNYNFSTKFPLTNQISPLFLYFCKLPFSDVLHPNLQVLKIKLAILKNEWLYLILLSMCTITDLMK
jgi:hypothetical protein